MPVLALDAKGVATEMHLSQQIQTELNYTDSALSPSPVVFDKDSVSYWTEHYDENRDKSITEIVRVNFSDGSREVLDSSFSSDHSKKFDRAQKELSNRVQDYSVNTLTELPVTVDKDFKAPYAAYFTYSSAADGTWPMSYVVDGKTSWSVSLPDQLDESFSDGKRVMASDDSGISVFDSATGALINRVEINSGHYCNVVTQPSDQAVLVACSLNGAYNYRDFRLISLEG